MKPKRLWVIVIGSGAALAMLAIGFSVITPTSVASPVVTVHKAPT